MAGVSVPPYLPELAPNDFFFLRMKLLTICHAIPKNHFQCYFEQWQKYYSHCISSEGDCFATITSTKERLRVYLVVDVVQELLDMLSFILFY
jgi:hypothetical protein